MNAARMPRQQYAALAWRRVEDVEILLVTSRRTRRWVIPKGWPIAGLAPHEAAAQEAFEEAGVNKGAVDNFPTGCFHYVKRQKGGISRMCRVNVYALKVEGFAENWPEKSVRSTRWFSLQEAAAMVDEPELKELILSFRP